MGRVKDFEGQCSNNADTGSWFSLTSGAKCGSEQNVGDNCAWKSYAHVTTITAECLFSYGIEDACTYDANIPFADATLVLQEALAGCENVSSKKSFSVDADLSPTPTRF